MTKNKENVKSGPPPMVNIDELKLNDFGHGENFAAKLGPIGRSLGTKKMGCGMVVLEPGKRGWPLHEHYAQEELFIIIEGEGTIRYGDGEYPVRTGDVIFTPPGQGTAHQIINTSNTKLRYLALSTTDSPEICYYPDSGKYGSYHYAGGGYPVQLMTHESSRVDYWEGED